MIKTIHLIIIVNIWQINLIAIFITRKVAEITKGVTRANRRKASPSDCVRVRCSMYFFWASTFTSYLITNCTARAQMVAIWLRVDGDSFSGSVGLKSGIRSEIYLAALFFMMFCPQKRCEKPPMHTRRMVESSTS